MNSVEDLVTRFSRYFGSTLSPSQWSSLCGSISSFVYRLETRKIFLKVWTRDLLTPMDFSSWTHPLATSLLCRNWVAHPPLPSAPLAAMFQGKLWSGCIKWGRGLRLWSLVSQTCLWQQNSNMLLSLGKILSLKCSAFCCCCCCWAHVFQPSACWLLWSD